MSKVQKTENQILLDVISKESLRDQEELLEKIKERGIEMTQSTLSRRLRKLGVKKRHGVYIAIPERMQSDLSRLIKRIDPAPPNLLMLHTLPGHAQALAYQLDYVSANDPQSLESQNEETGFKEILGTIAGDDTVLIVTANERDLKQLQDKLKKLR